MVKTHASIADKVLIESVIVKLTPEGSIVNKKTLQGLDSFFNSTKVIDNIHPDSPQNHCTNSCDISSSILNETYPSFANPCDNSAYKENTQHIHTNIDTFKRKPESDDMLHFSKTAKLKATFNALKTHATCSIGARDGFTQSIFTKALTAPVRRSEKMH